MSEFKRCRLDDAFPRSLSLAGSYEPYNLRASEHRANCFHGIPKAFKKNFGTGF